MKNDNPSIPQHVTINELRNINVNHNELFSIEGTINRDKLVNAMKKVQIDENQMSLDIENGDVKNIVLLSTFLANGAGARGTPTIFINEEFFGGYISLEQMKSLLNQLMKEELMQ